MPVPSNPDVLLDVRDLRVHYSLRRPHPFAAAPKVYAVDGISFQVRRGSAFGIVGESGCGKSTTALALMQLIRSTGGHATLDGIDLLMVSGYSFFTPGPRAAVMALLKAARDRGIATAIDPASVGFLREVGAEAFLKWTAGTGTIFANLDEALELTGSVDLNLQMQTLGRFYPRVVIKRGVGGAAIGGRSGVQHTMAAPPRDVIDTTGAGDAFAAAFLTAELKGNPVEACLKAGIDAGAEAVTSVGGQPVVR